MSTDISDFKEKYKVDQIRLKAVSDFKAASNFSFSKDVRQFMYQFMATVGLELEAKFADFVSFDDKSFRLFGREKSEKSIDTKKELNIKDYDKKLKSALETGNLEDMPSRVRPIFDLYAFKLVCPEIKNPQSLISTVIVDILNDIKAKHPECALHVTSLLDLIETSYQPAIEFIDSEFYEEYPELKKKILLISQEQKSVYDIQNFLDNSNVDLEHITYSDYYSKIIECYQILIELSYEESIDEYTRIAASALELREDFNRLVESGKSKELIHPDQYEEYDSKFQALLEHISRKKTNKLDLALGDLMVFDVLYTSRKVRELGVNVSKDPTRTKEKRKPNGYVANFYSLDMPNGLTSEIQLQSLYRYTYGESGPAAHNKMENGVKKRTLYPMPKEKREYKNWAEKQFKMLPKYFRYLGHGFVQVYNTLQNFRRYYDTESPEEVQTYVKYIAEHNIEQLDSDIMHFSLDDKPLLINETHETHAESEDSR